MDTIELVHVWCSMNYVFCQGKACVNNHGDQLLLRYDNRIDLPPTVSMKAIPIKNSISLSFCSFITSYSLCSMRPSLNSTKSTSTQDTEARNVKSPKNISLRQIGRMGQSMSNMMSKTKEEKTQDGDLDHTPLPTMNISTKQWEQAEANLLSDIKEVRLAMDLFLNSRIPESEKILEPKRYSTLYHSMGWSFVLFLRSVMTFQHSDIEEAIEALKKTIQLADALRKKNSGWLGNITSWVKGISVHDVWEMSSLHRHAVSSNFISNSTKETFADPTL